MKKLLWFLIAGSRGGYNRARIIALLHDRPYNANQISERLGLDYKTVKHHLKVLEENNIVVPVGKRYGTVYFLSRQMEENYDEFEEIWNDIKGEMEGDSNDTST